ncbi:MAG: diadenylate cyclase CdaA [Clostridia bacterium]
MPQVENTFVAGIYKLAQTFNLTSPLGILVFLVDVVIVCFMGIYLVNLLKGTRAKQIIKGIGILILLLFISQILELKITSFILENIMTYGVLLILVVFQPELRSALEKIGRSKFQHLFFNEETDLYRHTIAEIAKAVEIMSFKKIGALIVFERDTKIGDIVKEGIELNARVSSQLVQNIFIPKAPLHDGAIVICENQIKAASCVLPLASESRIDKNLGTRHRAAVGITEVSDALVVVVSEETGVISYVEDGKMKRNLTSEELKEVLIEKVDAENKYANTANDLKTNIKKQAKKIKTKTSKKN